MRLLVGIPPNPRKDYENLITMSARVDGGDGCPSRIAL